MPAPAAGDENRMLPESQLAMELRHASRAPQHPATLEGWRKKSFKFLMGWLGGPPLYEQEFGHPRLRARHFGLEAQQRGVKRRIA
jgi:truncated hemoglobin YjbI